MGQPQRRRVENEPYDARRVASRPTMAGGPSMMTSPPPSPQPSVGVAGPPSTGGYAVPNATTGNRSVPNVSYPTTGFPADYPRANPVGNPPPRVNVPVEEASSRSVPPYPYRYTD